MKKSPECYNFSWSSTQETHYSSVNVINLLQNDCKKLRYKNWNIRPTLWVYHELNAVTLLVLSASLIHMPGIYDIPLNYPVQCEGNSSVRLPTEAFGNLHTSTVTCLGCIQSYVIKGPEGQYYKRKYLIGSEQCRFLQSMYEF